LYQQASKDIHETAFDILQEQSARLIAICETKARVKAAFGKPEALSKSQILTPFFINWEPAWAAVPLGL
jgi:hypothetical protein